MSARRPNRSPHLSLDLSQERHKWELPMSTSARVFAHPDGKVYHLFWECESVRDGFENITRLASSKRLLRLCPGCHAVATKTRVSRLPAGPLRQ